MSGPGATPIVVDTGPLYARLAEDDNNHERAQNVFNAIRRGDLVYRPIYVTGYVLSELATLTIYNLGTEVAIDALERIKRSDLFTAVHPTEEMYAGALQSLSQFDDQQISLADHMTGVVADENDVDSILAFDSDFRTLGYSLVPDDVHIPGP